MKKKKYLIWGSCFVISLIIGFVGTKLTMTLAEQPSLVAEQDTDIQKRAGDVSQSTEAPNSHVNDTASVETPDVETVDSVSANDAEKDPIADKIKEEEAKKKAEEAKKKAEEAKKKAESKNRMSASTIQALILSGDASILGGRNPKVAKNISISVSGMHSGEKRPGDIVDLRHKIAHGIWKTLSVISVGYDNNNKINSIVVQPIYSESSSSTE